MKKKKNINFPLIIKIILSLLFVVAYPIIVFASGIVGDQKLTIIAYLIIFAGGGFLLGFLFSRFWKAALIMLWPVLVVIIRAPMLLPVVLTISIVPAIEIWYCSKFGKYIFEYVNRENANA